MEPIETPSTSSVAVLSFKILTTFRSALARCLPIQREAAEKEQSWPSRRSRPRPRTPPSGLCEVRLPGEYNGFSTSRYKFYSKPKETPHLLNMCNAFVCKENIFSQAFLFKLEVFLKTKELTIFVV